ncbi:hypothetical protein [Riemerella anatipestifer]|uniref:hypothetical protein n=1 Tax=Riemerella anatipestifer TaxID=34085 RepID=UPI00129D5A42|nr:hypothetical protein [Riemerella anatipestifer]MBT0550543.1 hypothetical protein [Riemerella anatipestifer]MBT0553347.1 hypothetical protein [Riemerella anatipestifer]MCE3023344.1 hypothetical protein [Riemerella anatipestifer]MCU7542452.1 hypothetical protein [Riemerella anatipestifer]MCU7559320.1 hypothetical protein [Riemerella anatipestifer]
MTTKITKLSVLAFLGLGLVAYGQSGKVGVNTSSPQATLDIQPTAKNGDITATTNEGILAPKLSKTRVASIATPVEGTLVYVLDDASKTKGAISDYIGNDSKVAKITEKGYYYYNGTEWVKSTTGKLEQEWLHNGSDAIYAKRAKENTPSNTFEILDNGKTYINQGGVDWTILKNLEGLPLFSANPRGHLLNAKYQSSRSLPTTNIEIDHNNTGIAGYTFNSSSAFVEANHVNNAQGNKKLYQSSSESITVSDNITQPLYYVRGKAFHTLVGDQVSADIEFIRGISSTAVRGGAGNSKFSAAGYFASTTEDNAVVTFGEAVRGGVSTKNGGTINNMVEGRFSADVMGGNTTNSIGVRGAANTYTEQTANVSRLFGGDFYSVGNSSIVIGEMRGVSGHAEIKGNTTSNEVIGGHFSTQLNNSSNLSLVRGAKILHMLQETPSVSEMIGVQTGIIRKAEAISVSTNIANYYGFVSDNLLEDNSFTGSITNYYDYFAKDAQIAPNKIANYYGFYINGLNKTNYLEGKMGIGVNAPAEKLEVAGNVKATGFIGTNAAIFPDYVFQKYYTGTSSLKADYSFKTLSQVEDFVKTNGHLPGYQSAETIKKQGYIDLMATQLTNVEKIEELYLHSIEQDKALKAKDTIIKELKSEVSNLEARLQKLEALLVK